MGSVLLWGPPGTGKTTIASLIAHQTGRRFISANAAMIGVKDIRDAIDSSRRHIESGEKATILFLDEIHRFSRSQQDVLLGDVERGIITLIGATTENPRMRSMPHWPVVRRCFISSPCRRPTSS